MYDFFISTLLVFVGIFSIVFLLFVWKRVQMKGIEENIEARLRQIARDNGIELSEMDYFQFKMLALDELNNKIIFVDDTVPEEIIVDLDHVSECRLIQKQLSSQLELVLKDGYQESICIPFYRRYHDRRSLRKKLAAKAERWKETIDEALLKAAVSPAV